MFQRGFSGGTMGPWGQGPAARFGGYGYPAWYPWVHLIGMAVFMIIAIVFIILLWRKWGRNLPALSAPGPAGAGTQGVNNALEILQVRYAKGEITSEEYHKIKEDLLA